MRHVPRIWRLPVSPRSAPRGTVLITRVEEQVSDVAVLGVAPGEAFAGGHLEDDRVVLAEGVRSSMARLGLATPDVATRGAQPQTIVRAAFLAAIAVWSCHDQWRVLAEGVGGDRIGCAGRIHHAKTTRVAATCYFRVQPGERTARM